MSCISGRKWDISIEHKINSTTWYKNRKIINYVMEGNEIWFDQMSSGQLDAAVKAYNFDDGFRYPRMMIDSPACDLGIALQIFYLSDGYSFLCGFESSDKNWKGFLQDLYDRIINGRYKVGEVEYEIPLTKVQRYKLSNNNVDNVFLNDIL